MSYSATSSSQGPAAQTTTKAGNPSNSSASSVAASDTLIIPTYIPPGHEVLVVKGDADVQHIRIIGSTQVVIRQVSGLRNYDDTSPAVVGGRNLNAGNLVDPSNTRIFWWHQGSNTIVVTIQGLGSDPDHDADAIIEGIRPATEAEWQDFNSRFAGSS